MIRVKGVQNEQIFINNSSNKLKSFPKPKTTENINKINSSNAQVVTYGKNSPIIDNASKVKGAYVTHGDNSPVVLGQKR